MLRLDTSAALVLSKRALLWVPMALRSMTAMPAVISASTRMAASISISVKPRRARTAPVIGHAPSLVLIGQ